MGLPMDELSDTKIRNATPSDKEYAVADGQGLSVVVRPNGTKLWLFRYRFGGQRKYVFLHLSSRSLRAGAALAAGLEQRSGPRLGAHKDGRPGSPS
jgi:hypothetical protein